MPYHMPRLARAANSENQLTIEMFQLGEVSRCEWQCPSLVSVLDNEINHDPILNTG